MTVALKCQCEIGALSFPADVVVEQHDDLSVHAQVTPEIQIKQMIHGSGELRNITSSVPYLVQQTDFAVAQCNYSGEIDTATPGVFRNATVTSFEAKMREVGLGYGGISDPSQAVLAT